MTDKWLEKLLTFRAKRHTTKKVLLITGVADENSLAWGIAIHAALYRSVTGIILAIYPSEGGKARV